jgi:hypothetical protein
MNILCGGINLESYSLNLQINRKGLRSRMTFTYGEADEVIFSSFKTEVFS